MNNTVVMVVHNIASRSKEILGMTDTALNSLRETADQPYDMWIVDNGSNDNDVCWNFLIEHEKKFRSAGVHCELTLSVGRRNQPVAQVWNVVIKQAPEGNILLVNNDVTFNRKGWMSTLTSPLRVSSVGAAGSHMMGWSGFSFLEGSFLAFRKAVAMQVASDGKVFDEQFTFTCEEVDFCQRLQLAGYQLIEVPIESNGTVTHLHHGTLSWTNEEGGINGESALLVMHENRRRLCRKYGRPERVND